MASALPRTEVGVAEGVDSPTVAGVDSPTVGGRRSVGDVEELTRMEKILDEWTPYASLDHVHTGHWHTSGVGGRGRGNGRGGGRGRGAQNNEHFRNEKKDGCRGISEEGSRGDTSAGVDPGAPVRSHGGETQGDNDDSTERRGSSWRYRQEAARLSRDRRGKYGSAEGRAARKKEKLSATQQARNNWLTEASVNHIDDFHSDDFTDINSSDRSLIRSHKNFHSDNFLGLSSREKNLARSLKNFYGDDLTTFSNSERKLARSHENFHCDIHSDINSRDQNSTITLGNSLSKPREINSRNKMLCATTQTPLTMSLKKPPSTPSVDVRDLNSWMSGSNAEDEDEDVADFGYVKRGIKFWDAERRQKEEERERNIRVAKWRQKEEEKRVREEEWIYKEEDTVWVAKADKSIRLKNQRERQLQEERKSAGDRGKKARETKERIFSTRKGLQSQGNYWRIGYGDKAINKELRVVRISDEQLTSF